MLRRLLHLIPAKGNSRRQDPGPSEPPVPAASGDTPEPSEPALAWPPGHFYSPIPDLGAIAGARNRVFASAAPSLPGIDLNDAGQVALFERLCTHYNPDYFPERPASHRRYHFDNDNFRHGEALILASMLRHLRPKRLIEVGSGYSSCVTLDTRDGLGSALKCTFVEPYPDLLHSLLREGDHAEITIVPKPVQDVETELFMELEANDILFIDSTHVCKTDSDVNHHLFRILPALKSGVYIHFHDIFFPFEYPAEWVFQGRAWNELYAIRAFLQYNNAFAIAFFNSYFAQAHAERFSEGMPLATQSPGSSFWLRKV